MAQYDYNYQYPTAPQGYAYPPQAGAQQPTAPEAYGAQAPNQYPQPTYQSAPPAASTPQYGQDPYAGQYQQAATAAPSQYSSAPYNNNPNGGGYAQPPPQQYSAPAQDPYGYQAQPYSNVSTDYNAYPQDPYASNAYPGYEQYPPQATDPYGYGNQYDQGYQRPASPPPKPAPAPARKVEEPEVAKGADGTERFRCTVIPSDDAEPESVVVQVGLDGVHVLDEDAKRTARIYPLESISRWALREPTVLTFWTKTSASAEECTVRIMATEKATRTILDTLTCCCLQLCELQPNGPPQAEEDDEDEEEDTAKRSWSLFGRGESSGAADEDDVDFWNGAEHEGFLTKQGEHIKTWRRRWFVLKKGKIFWFKESDVKITSKPRGVINLKDIKDVDMVTGSIKIAKGYAFEMVMQSGDVQYFIADTETEQMAWMAEIEAKAREAKGKGKGRSGSAQDERLSHSQMAARLREGMERLSVTTDSSARGSERERESYTPKTPVTPSAPPAAPPQPVQYPWAMAVDDYGKPYYYHQVTGATQWEPPN